MKTAALLLALSLAACGSDSRNATEDWRMPGGGGSQTLLERDNAACNNEARAIVGMNRYAWFSQARRDCMISRGWVPAT